MTSRITQTLSELKKTNQKALITYVTAGDPTMNITEELIYVMEEGGADIIELGIPYSDPLADGPVIQRAASRSLGKGVNIDLVFKTVENVRKNTQIPLLFLLYYNSIFRYGIERFLILCKKSGIDGLIIPDLPLEEREIMHSLLKDYDIDLIPMVAPTSEERIKEIVTNASGFVYCVSSLGITGARKQFEGIETFMHKVRSNTTLPLAIGFGISDSRAVKRLKDLADGLIVGTAIVKKVEDGIEANNSVILVKQLVKELKAAFG